MLKEKRETMTVKVLSVNCPTCSTQVIMNEKSRFRPFCSERCKSLDFGEWATENHKIPGKFLDEEDMWSEENVD